MLSLQTESTGEIYVFWSPLNYNHQTKTELLTIE